jgi:predicted short-subunit dehydrogenase-like oxidoreductase (DUF2520 family)
LAAPLFVAGRGRVGRSLARALRQAGHPTRLVAARGGARRLVRALGSEARAIVFLAVPDVAVAGYARELADAPGLEVPASVAFVHVSGSLGLDALSSLARRHDVGSFHPLRSFPRPQPPAAFRGVVVAVDASRPALSRRLERIARDLGARPRLVAGADRMIYHAAAVFASNYGVVLLGVAAGLLESIGWSEKEAVAGLLPLMTGAVDEAGRIGVAGALTGPARRGDVSTIQQHLIALERVEGGRSGLPVIDLYRMLGSIAVEIAREAGLGPAAAGRVNRALTRKVAATRRRRRR